MIRLLTDFAMCCIILGTANYLCSLGTTYGVFSGLSIIIISLLMYFNDAGMV